MTQTGFIPLGAIFDLDDTLLDNQYDANGAGLHERLRFDAVREVGREQGISALENITIEQSVNAFLTAKVTSFEYALWNLLCIAGIRHNPDEPDTADELMIEITRRKNARYQQILETTVKEVPGSTRFVQKMNELTDGTLAIGSSARESDITRYLTTKGLIGLFSDRRIVSIEHVMHAKPHPEVFERAFASLDLDPIHKTKVCVFEDDPKGVMAAKAAGLFACAITTRYSRAHFEGLAVQPDFIADTYDEMAEFFNIK